MRTHETDPAPTTEEKAKILDLMVDLFYTHGVEIHNLWEDEELQGSTKEPLITSGFAISSNGHIISVFPAETYLTVSDLEEAIHELKETNA